MKVGGQGLVDVPTEDLKRALRFIHRGDLPCPIDSIGLARVGLQYQSEGMNHLRGLDARATQAVIVAVLAERDSRERSR